MAATLDDRQHYTKGKGKADTITDPTETTPLLDTGSSQSSRGDSDLDLENNSAARRQLWTKLVFVFSFSLALCLVFFFIAALLAYSYAARLAYVKPDDVLANALVVEGPDRVDLINATDGGLWLRLDARVGIDAGSIIGVNTDNDEGTLKDLFKSFGRLGIQLLGTVTANISTLYVHSSRDVLLAKISAFPVQFPITSNPPQDSSWLTPVSVPVFVQPTDNTSDIMQFMDDSWRHGFASVRASVPIVGVWGGSSPDARGWRSILTAQFENVKTQISLPIDPIPGLPEPGHDEPLPSFAELVKLESFDISSTSKEIHLNARASVINPLPAGIEMTIPALPFIVSLPAASDQDSNTYIPIASAEIDSFSLTHPNVTLAISGRVLPLPSTAIKAVSSFASRYLSLRPNPISISTPLLPSLVVNTEFPSPATKPKILRDVTIRDMKVKPYGTEFLASGEVYAHLVLPKGMNFKMDVKRIMPDIMVFDGEVDNSYSLLHALGNVPSHLPEPLPPRAFGHIKPDDWLGAKSVYNGTDEEGSTFLVSSSIVDVPIQVLPGREKEFSDFVSKILFSKDGATAGLQGTVDVGVDIVGLPFHDGDGKDIGFTLNGLPLQGNVRIGKKMNVGFS